MAVSFVDYQLTEQLTQSTSAMQGTIPATVQAGDALVAFVQKASASGTSGTPSGWTKLHEVGAGTTSVIKLAVYYRIAASGDAGATVSFSTGGFFQSGVVVIAAWRGINSSGQFLGSNAQVDAAAATSHDIDLSALTPAANALVVTFFAYASNVADGTVDPPSGYTEQLDRYNSAVNAVGKTEFAWRDRPSGGAIGTLTTTSQRTARGITAGVAFNAPTSAQTFTQTLSATQSSSPTLARVTAATRSASSSASAQVARALSTTKSGIQATTASVTRLGSLVRSASSTVAAAIASVTARTWTATTSASASIAQATSIIITAEAASVVSAVRSISRTLAAPALASAQLAPEIHHDLAAAIASSATLVRARAAQLAAATQQLADSANGLVRNLQLSAQLVATAVAARVISIARTTGQSTVVTVTRLISSALIASSGLAGFFRRRGPGVRLPTGGRGGRIRRAIAGATKRPTTGQTTTPRRGRTRR